jgi:hypothetical protein
MVDSEHHQGRNEMSIFENNDAINAILSQLADEGMVEPMVEPIDESDCHPMDWAEVTGLADELTDEIYPEMKTMIDEDGFVWYVS